MRKKMRKGTCKSRLADSQSGKEREDGEPKKNRIHQQEELATNTHARTKKIRIKNNTKYAIAWCTVYLERRLIPSIPRYDARECQHVSVYFSTHVSYDKLIILCLLARKCGCDCRYDRGRMFGDQNASTTAVYAVYRAQSDIRVASC